MLNHVVKEQKQQQQNNFIVCSYLLIYKKHLYKNFGKSLEFQENCTLLDELNAN